MAPRDAERAERAPGGNGQDAAPAMVAVQQMRKTYGDVVALDQVSFATGRGEILAVLGPNGAGKSTLVRCLSTIDAPDSGNATVAGYDVRREPREVRKRIAVTGQFATVDDPLTCRENLILVGVLRGLKLRAATRRADELLEEFALTEHTKKPAGRLSGGLRRRLDLAASLVDEPAVLMLDEPTTGLDPASRRALWDRVAALAAGGCTVVLTTQYIEEADRLAGHVLLLQRGEIIASGTPAQLKDSIADVEVAVGFADEADAAALHDRLDAATPLSHGATVRNGRIVRCTGTDAVALTRLALDMADELGLHPQSLDIVKPSLEDAFLALLSERATP